MKPTHTLTVYRDTLGEWRWRIKSRNGRIVAESGEGYKRRSTMLRTLRRLFENGQTIVAEYWTPPAGAA